MVSSATTRIVILLVDSQADISIIKISALKQNNKINYNDIIFMKGITSERQKSLGSVILDIKIQNYAIDHKFYVVSNDFPMPSDGILGKEFLKKHRCVLNYEQMTFSCKPIGYDAVEIPLQSEIAQGKSVVPPNSEIFRPFQIKSRTFPCVVEAQNISEHVVIPTTIAHSEISWIRVLNTTDEFRVIETNKLECSNINNYDIFMCNDSSKSDNKTREEQLINILRQNTPKHAIKLLTPLCTEFSEIFHLNGDKPTVNNFYKQKLTLKDNETVYTRNYRLPQSQKVEIAKEVNKLYDDSLIEASKSNYNAPLILVPKKSVDGSKKFRMCVDYRRLNRKLIPDRFPMPRIEDIFDNLGSSKYFSVMDLQAGYHQIPIKRESRKYTAFSTENGMYQWKVLPFGLSIAPSSFSRMMALAFSGLSPEHCFSYMDDLIVIGYSEKNHIENLKKVFEVCRKCNLKLNPSKCQFFRTEVSFLGHICTDHGLKPDPKKLLAVEKYPRPTDKDAVRRFVAFTNYYRRFVENFAKITKPLTNLTQKRVAFNWTEECESSFQLLKKKLLTTPILKYPDFNKPFKILTDASDFACGATLTQSYDGLDMPITYISRSFKKGEKNKPPIEKELLAVHFAITQFRPYVYGRHFTVQSDHKPLVYLYSLKNPSSRLSRIRLDLEEYDYDIQYIKGKDNVVADALSRISVDELKHLYDDIEVFAITRSMKNTTKNEIGAQPTTTDGKCEQLKVYEDFNTGFTKKVPRLKTKAITVDKSKGSIQNITIVAYKAHSKLFEFKLEGKVNMKLLFTKLQDAASAKQVKKLQISLDDSIFKLCNIDEFKSCGNEALRNLSIMIIKPPINILNECEKLEIFKKFHDDPIYGGHPGQKKLYAKIRSNYQWKGMTKDIARFIASCENCRANKHKPLTKEEMVITKTPSKPFDTLIIDTIGPLAASNGKLYVVTIICDLTKYLVCAPVRDKSAKEVAKAIFEKFILIYGPMKNIRTDRGTEYTNELISELCRLMHIKHSTSTAYHHQSVGTIERNHREFNKYMRQYLESNLGDWENYIEFFTFCYNIEKHGSNNYQYSPYELVFARSPNLPSTILSNKVEPLYNHDNYIKEAKFRLQNAHKMAKQLIEKMKINNKNYYDRNCNPLDVNVGETVHLKIEPYQKLQTLSKPYKVIAVNQPNVTLSDGINTINVHKNRLMK